MDFTGLFYIQNIESGKLGDAAVLKVLIKILSENNINVIRLNTFNPEFLKKGFYTKLKPSKEEKKEIIKGTLTLKINSYNHIQGLIARDKRSSLKKQEKVQKK